MSRHPSVEPENWSGVDLLLLEHQDRTPLKRALIAAIGIHLIVFWWNIWPQGKPLPVLKPEKPPFLVRTYKPPEIKPEKMPLRDPKAMRVPIPDPTPHEVEPIFEAVPDPEPMTDLATADDVFEDYLPVADPPPPAAPVRDYMLSAPPVPLHKVEPVYPRLAQIAQKEGLVILEAVIRKDGTVGEVTVRRAPEGKFGFEQAAVTALRQWRFRPGEMHGIKVDVIMTLTIKFRLDR